MARRCLTLGLPEISAVIGEVHRKERVGWRKNRLLAVKLAAEGKMTSAEVADACGISRGHLFEWLKAVRTGGLEALLDRFPKVFSETLQERPWYEVIPAG